jgi:hypothetical protein
MQVGRKLEFDNFSIKIINDRFVVINKKVANGVSEISYRPVSVLKPSVLVNRPSNFITLVFKEAGIESNFEFVIKVDNGNFEDTLKTVESFVLSGMFQA